MLKTAQPSIVTDRNPPAEPTFLPGFHVLVSVWGNDYCDLFTRISLPSQLAAGNLPALPHKERCLYHVFTRPDDAERIEASSAWKQLKSLMPVRIDLWNEEKRTPHETMSDCLRRGIAVADDQNAASLFFNPDLIFADGTIDVLAQLVKHGQRVVFTTGIRLLKETVVPEIERAREPDGIIALTPRELAGIGLRNLHPIALNNFWFGGKGTLVPATLFWPVGDEGLLARCFHLHPLLVWPERKHVVFDGTVDDDFPSMACPRSETDYIVDDSDQLLICEISAFSDVTETSYRKGSIDGVVDWAEMHTDRRHRQLVTVPIRFHTIDVTEALWKMVEIASGHVIDETLRRLDRSWTQLLMRSPALLLRRWVRAAANASIAERNLRRDVTIRGRIAALYLSFYRNYAAFCARYEKFRDRLDDMLFGSAEDPRPWNGHSFTIARPVAGTLALLPSRSGRTLIIAEKHEIRHRLVQAFDSSVALGWPSQTTAAQANDRLPYPDGSFDIVACVGALQQIARRDRFLLELARITAPHGRAVLALPLLQGDPAPTDSAHRHFSMQDLTAIIPDAWQIETYAGLGAIGSTLVTMVYSRSEGERRTRRLSPVILEIPILPILLLARFLAGCAAALGARLVDMFDRTGSFHTYQAIVLVRREG